MSYVYEKEGEYKGFGKRDKYKPRIFKITAEGVFECYEKKKCRISINLLKETWTDLTEVSGQDSKSYWSFQYSDKTYNFSSPNDNERALIMKTLQTFYDKQQSMDKTIDSGAYNRDEPNQVDFEELEWIYENSTLPQYDNNYYQRMKDRNEYWPALKKDPYWKRDLYLLKEKHGVLELQEKEQQQKESEKKGQKMMENFSKQKSILSAAMKSAGFKFTGITLIISTPPGISCTISNLDDEKQWNDDDINKSQFSMIGKIILRVLRKANKFRNKYKGSPLRFTAITFEVTIPPKISLSFEPRDDENDENNENKENNE
eukprot:501203_1